jgi:hypothetical protein
MKQGFWVAILGAVLLAGIISMCAKSQQPASTAQAGHVQKAPVKEKHRDAVDFANEAAYEQSINMLLDHP